MISNLKVNTNNFKKKIIYTTTVLVMSSAILSGCSVVNDKNKDELSTDNTYRLEITLNLDNYENLEEKDLLVVYDDNNTIYNATNVDNDIKTILVYPESLDNLNISSEALDTSIDLPNITEDETYEVNIDYATKTYDVEIIEKQKDKGMGL